MYYKINTHRVSTLKGSANISHSYYRHLFFSGKAAVFFTEDILCFVFITRSLRFKPLTHWLKHGNVFRSLGSVEHALNTRQCVCVCETRSDVLWPVCCSRVCNVATYISQSHKPYKQRQKNVSVWGASINYTGISTNNEFSQAVIRSAGM